MLGPPDPEDVAEYVSMVEDFRERLINAEDSMRLFLELGEGLVTAREKTGKISKSIEKDLDEIRETWDADFAGQRWITAMHPAPLGRELWPSQLKKETDATKKRILTIINEIKEKNPEEVMPEEEVAEEPEKSEQERAQDYIDEWTEYSELLKRHVETMEPFELFENPKEALERGLAKDQADALETERDDMLEKELKNWEDAVGPENEIPKTLLKPWTPAKFKEIKGTTDTRILKILRFQRGIEGKDIKGEDTKRKETATQLGARLRRIRIKARWLGGALKRTLASIESKRGAEADRKLKFQSLAIILDSIFLTNPVRGARRYLRRLKKEVKRIGKKGKKTIEDQVAESLAIVKEAAAGVTKKALADIMHERSPTRPREQEIRDSVKDRVDQQMVEVLKAAQKSLEAAEAAKRRRLRKTVYEAHLKSAVLFLNKAMDLIEVASDRTYRLFGYDPENEKIGVDAEKEREEVKAVTNRIRKVQKRLSALEPEWAKITVPVQVKKKKKKKPKRRIVPVVRIPSPEPPLELPEEEEPVRGLAPICDIMPTLANVVLPSERYETVRIQVRRRAPAHAGVTDRVRTDAMFETTDELRVGYRRVLLGWRQFKQPTPTSWPINALALSGLDAEIYRRVFAAQKSGSPFRGAGFESGILELKHLRVKAFNNLLESATDKDAMRASMGTDVLTGNTDVTVTVKKEMQLGTWMGSLVMGYLLRVYLGVRKYDKSAVADPLIWNTAAKDISGARDKDIEFRPPKWWISSEVFQYKVPPSALPLGTDRSDRILLDQCGIALVLVVLNQTQRHWSLLAYPVRRDPKKRRLYHYDSMGHQPPRDVEDYMRGEEALFIRGGLFSPDVLDRLPDKPREYKYLVNPKFNPEDLACRQRDGWRCGYMSLTVLDVLCRKAERSPETMSDPPDPLLGPLLPGDVPTPLEQVFADSVTDETRRSAYKTTPMSFYTDSILTRAREWAVGALPPIVRTRGDRVIKVDSSPWTPSQAPAWALKVAKRTVWKVQEPFGAYTDKTGYPDPLKVLRPEQEEKARRRREFVRRREKVGKGPARRVERPGAASACVARRPGREGGVGAELSQQDAWSIWDLGNDHTLYALFDGHDLPEAMKGQKGAGEQVADDMAREFPEMLRYTLRQHDQTTNPTTDQEKDDLLESVRQAFQNIDRAKFAKGVEDNPWWFKGGCTALCALVSHSWIHLFSLGDSRGIAMTRGIVEARRRRRKPKVEAATTDERIAINKVKMPGGVVGDFALRSFWSDVDPAFWPGVVVTLLGRTELRSDPKEVVSAIRRDTYGGGSLVLLGTDGFWDKMLVNDHAMKEVFAAVRDEGVTSRACERVLAKAIGGLPRGITFDDNATVMIVDATKPVSVVSSSPPSSPVPKRPTTTTTKKTYVGNGSRRNLDREEWSKILCLADSLGKDSKGKPLRLQDAWSASDLGNGHFLYVLYEGHDRPTEVELTHFKTPGSEVARNLSYRLPGQLMQKFQNSKVVTNPSNDAERKLFEEAVRDVFKDLDKQIFKERSDLWVRTTVREDVDPWSIAGVTAICALVTPDWIHLFNLGDPRAIVIGQVVGEKQPRVAIATEDYQIPIGSAGIMYPRALIGLFLFRRQQIPARMNEYPGLFDKDQLFPAVFSSAESGKQSMPRPPDTRTLILMGNHGFWTAFSSNEEAMRLVLKALKGGKKKITAKRCASILKRMRKTKEGSKFGDNAHIMLIDITRGVGSPPGSSITGSMSSSGGGGGSRSVAWVQSGPENFW